MGKFKNNRTVLNSSEQKTTAAFKLLTAEIKTLKLSLKKTQDELELYRSKYFDADKNHAIQLSKNSVLIFHEFIKFLISTICGGVGVNFITDGRYIDGIILIVIAAVLYYIVIFTDRK